MKMEFVEKEEGEKERKNKRKNERKKERKIAKIMAFQRVAQLPLSVLCRVGPCFTEFYRVLPSFWNVVEGLIF